MVLLEGFNKLFSESILVEDIAAVQAMFPEIDNELFYNIIKLDPTYIEGKDSVGTYGKWLLRLFRKGNLTENSFEQASEILKGFEAKKKWMKIKDIGQYRTLADLEKAVNETEEGELSHAQKIRQVRKKIGKVDLDRDSEVVFEDNKWIIISPKTYEASCKLGYDTNWCTASKEDRNYYDEYTEEGPLYIIINQQNPNEKYQAHIESGSFMDRQDHAIPVKKFFSENPSLKKFFVDKITKPIFDKLNLDLNAADTDTFEYTIATADLVDDLKYKRLDRGSEAIDGETAIDLLNYEADFWDPSIYNVDYSSDCFKYYVDEIMEELKEAKTLDNILEQLGLTVEDIQHILEESRWDDEDHTDEENAVRQVMARALENGYAAGAEQSAHEDTLAAMEEALGVVKFNYDYDESNLTISVGNLRDMLEDLVFESDEVETEEMAEFLSDLSLDTLLSTKLAADFKLFEPYYGWDGFDVSCAVDYFLDFVLDEI